ncbi:MAG: hypothetical protein FJ225_13445 [Lentisphaerae bacterium]|nr:hypothetical protein [Lentisphaerota bacterium]
MRKVLVGLVLLGIAAGLAIAEGEKAASEAKTVAGVVAVTKDDAGAVTAVKVGDVAIALDDNGKKVAEMDGKKVEVTGTMKNKMLVVATVKAVEEEAPKAE